MLLIFACIYINYLLGSESATSSIHKKANLHLSYFFLITWHPPAFPHRLQCSIIGRLGLNHRVRDGNGCDPQAHRHQDFQVTGLRTRRIKIHFECLHSQMRFLFVVLACPTRPRVLGLEGSHPCCFEAAPGIVIPLITQQ